MFLYWFSTFSDDTYTYTMYAFDSKGYYAPALEEGSPNPSHIYVCKSVLQAVVFLYVVCEGVTNEIINPSFRAKRAYSFEAAYVCAV
jgi:hypothetical protein